MIRGPKDWGTPFKMFYNNDGSPNYVLSVRNQQQAANRNIPNNVARDYSQIQDRGEGYVSSYVRNLRSSISNVQALYKEHQEKLAKLPAHPPSGNISQIHSVRTNQQPSIQKNDVKPPTKNEPTIKR